MIIDYRGPPSLPSVTSCLLIITTNVIYHNPLHAQTRPPILVFFVCRSDPRRAAVSSRGISNSNLCECWAKWFLSERARHSYDVEEDEEEVEDCDASASIAENGAAMKLVRHFAHTGAQSGGGSGTDFKHMVHCQPQSVWLASSGLVKWSLEERPGFQTERAFAILWQGAGSGGALDALMGICSSLSSTLRESRDLL